MQFLAPETTPSLLCVAPGEPVVLSCELSRAGAPVVWSHNGRPVQEGEGLELHAEGPRRVLCIQAAGLAHAGLYTCQSGAAPGAPSLSFTVQVAGEYSLGTKPESGTPNPVGFLLFQHVLPIPGPASLSTLPIMPPPALLKALSLSPPVTSNSDSTEPPVRVVAPEAAQTRVRSTPGGDLELVVHLSGPGGPVRWYKDGERLASQGRVQLEQAGARQVLRVQGARSGDAGEYLCDAPQDSRIFLVSVEGNSVPLKPCGLWHPKDHLIHSRAPLPLHPRFAASGSNQGVHDHHLDRGSGLPFPETLM